MLTLPKDQPRYSDKSIHIFLGGKMKKYFVAFLVVFATVVLAVTFWSPFSNIVADKDMPDYGDEPDIPGFLLEAKSKFSKEEFMMKRAEGIALKRGISKDQPFDRKARQAAIREMELQEAGIAQMPESGKKDSLLAAWTAIGPAPIPNGQTQSQTTAVSGRVTAIDVHPSNVNIVYVGTAQGGVYRTTDGGVNWTPIFDSALSLAVGSIAIAPSQPETVYVGTGEPNFSADSYFGVGVYRINNASTTATLSGPFNQNAAMADIFSGRSIGEIIVHPANPDIIFVASTSGIGGLRSTGSVFPARGIYRSVNATSGTPTFAKLTGLIGNLDVSVRDMAIDPGDPNILVCVPIAGGANQGGIYQSTNALNADPTTVTFTQRVITNSTSTSVLNGELVGIHPGGDPSATFYAALGVSSGRVMRSTDGGVTWTTQITNGFCGGQCFYDIAIAVDPANVNNVYLGGDPTISSARSTNGGTSFTDNRVGVHVDTHALAVAPSDTTNVWLGTDGGIYKSTDSGLTWTQQNTTQFSATQFMGLDLHPTDPDFTIGGTQDNGTNMYCLTCGAPHTPPWRRVDFGDGGWAVIDQNAPDNVNVRMYHTYFNATTLQGYGTVSTTASASDGLWAFRGCNGVAGNGIACNGAVNFYAPLVRGPGNPNTIYYGSDRLYRSADNGTNHTVVSQNPIAGGVPISTIGISPQNDNVRIVGLNGGQIFGTNTGVSPLVDLDPANAVPNLPVNNVIVDPTNQNTAYVALSTFAVAPVYKTTNLNGSPPTWTSASTGLPLVPVNAIAVDAMNSNIVYAGTDIGVYVSSDGGANWTPLGTALPRVAVFGIGITNAAPRQVRIATHGRGMFQHPALGPTAASVSVGGRVLTPGGSGIGRVVVTMTDLQGATRSAQTNNFGFYRFEGVRAGETYVFEVRHKEFQFAAQIINVNDELTNLNFFPLP